MNDNSKASAARRPRYLSPSALMLWMQRPEEYYLKYMGPELPQVPQTQAMSAGSAFDYFVKLEIADRVWGCNSAEYDRLALLDPVADEWKTWALPLGDRLLCEYRRTGALARLMMLVGNAEPRMEITLEGSIAAPSGQRVPLLGKPDLLFERDGIVVVIDFKVNGAASATGASPKAGYQWISDKQTAHKDYMGGLYGKIEIDIGRFFESVYSDWALQCATYAWMWEADNIPRESKKVVVGIEQVVCRGSEASSIRFAQHRGAISVDYQNKMKALYCELWDRIARDHIFDCPVEESRARQWLLVGGNSEPRTLADDRHSGWMDALLQEQRKSGF